MANTDPRNKKLRPTKLKLKNFTGGDEKISFGKPEIKTKKQLELEKKESDKNTYLKEKGKTGIPVFGIHVPPDINIGNHF